MNTLQLLPRPLLFFAVIFSLLLLLLQPLQPTLLYQRESVLAGEVWRLWTASFVHTNYYHLTLNVAGFWLFLLLCAPVLRLKFLIFSMIFSALPVGSGLFLLNPGIIWYAGFSGIQYGLFLAGAILLTIQQEKLPGITLFIVVSGKLITDAFITGNSLSQTLINAPVIQQSHWYGTAAGIVSVLPEIIRTKRHQSLHV